MKTNKKAITELGIGILIMAALLLLGGIFMDSSNDNNTHIKNKNTGEYINEDYLFYLNKTDIGRQNKVTESFPNIELGSKEENNVIYIGNSFRLLSNPFSTNKYNFNIDFSKPEDVTGILIYFNKETLHGNNPIIIKKNGKQVLKTIANSNEMPLKIPLKIQNATNFSGFTISLEIDDVKWYQLFNWNKLEISELKIVEILEDKSNKEREFNFQVQTDNLEQAYIDLAISCDNTNEVSEPIKITVNDYIISNHNPNCQSRNTKLTANVPLNILQEKNTLKLETDGFYTVAYSINKVYFNDQDVYKFTINSFNDLIDVVMYGDFNKEYIDVRLNSQTLSLGRNEIKSIISYLQFGVNELKFLNKPVEIEEFIIEKNEYITQ